MNNKKTIIFLLIIVIIFAFFTAALKHRYFKESENIIIGNVKNLLDENSIKEDLEENIVFKDGSIGILKIPSISVEAPIYEGTNQEVLKYAIRAF